MIIELDGSQHLEQQQYDDQRTLFLKMEGYRVLRFWNNQVMECMEDVLEVILNVLPPSQSSPLKGEEVEMPSPMRGRVREGVKSQ